MAANMGRDHDDSGSGSIPTTTNSSAAVGSSSVPLGRRNGRGSRADVGWKYGISVEGTVKVQCKFCQKVFTGGIYRLKHHLAKSNQNVEACKYVPEDVNKEMIEVLTSLIKKTANKDDSLEIAEKRKVTESEGVEVESARTGQVFKKRSSQATINTIFKKGIREDACQAIARFFYNNAIPFNASRSEEFPAMCELIASHGPGFKPPSYHEIRVKYLKQEVKLTMGIIEEHKAVWKSVGCTIMTDGWTDKRRRTILNFLVNSPKGTVFLKSIDASHITKTADKIFKMLDEIVEEVGEENVVQIVTDNAANYKAAGEMLMEKRKNLYWTPCAAHCIDLMLEDFEKKIPLHEEIIPKGRKITTYIYSRTSLISLLQLFTKGKDLVRPGITRFATSYLTLGCLHENKGALLRMFTCDEWNSSKFSRTREGKLVEEIVLDNQFWKNILICLKGAYPLIKVLRLVDSDEKPAMGFIYEAMDQAKEAILTAFNGIKKSYIPLWNIIDNRWDKQLHRPLHAAGYFLNPQLHYSSRFKADLEVKRGLYDCLARMVPDIEEQAKIDIQIDDFKKRNSLFGSPLAKITLQKKTPTDWWESYGDEHPELQKFAVRVLSLTCSSSGCERNWSAFEMVHTKRRNRLKQKTMNDVVFVMVNSKLEKKKQVRRAHDLDLDDVSSDDEWIAENNVGDIEELEEDAHDLDLDGDECLAQDQAGQPGQNVIGNDVDMLNLDDEVDVNEDEHHMVDPYDFNVAQLLD